MGAVIPLIRRHAIPKPTLQAQSNMAGARRWLIAVRRTIVRSSCKTADVLEVHDVNGMRTAIINPTSIEEAEDVTTGETDYSKDEDDVQYMEAFSREELAAIRIQAYFRGHLARRAFRALRSLVRLQAVVRGVCVRRQARVAIHCMQAMVRLQVRVRARQLLGKHERGAQLS
uniref:Protein IQ-DOMAIN 31 n=1 Tax=Elaeis guineensis var. tenera TaxID=51953 RepID=A0A6I9R1S2_ELAGV|nr:protein IQ-DOMAIN 31 [Elaeis guineensis]